MSNKVEEVLNKFIKLDEKNWIAGVIKHPGAMTKAAEKEGVSNSTYEKEHEHDSGKSGARARLALTLKKMHKEETESVGTKDRTEIEYVARPDGDKPTSKKSKLGRNSAAKLKVDEQLIKINNINETIKKVVDEKKKANKLPPPTKVDFNPKLSKEIDN